MGSVADRPPKGTLTAVRASEPQCPVGVSSDPRQALVLCCVSWAPGTVLPSQWVQNCSRKR